MNQNDDNKNYPPEETNTPRVKELENMEDWRDEHGQPNYAYLKSLAADDNPAGMEKLKSIAEDLDVEFDSNTASEELIEKIMLTTQSDPNITT